MMSMLRMAFALIVPIVWLAACGPKDRTGAKTKSRSVTVSEDLSGTEIKLFRGQPLVVRLRSNPTTGFQWSMIELKTGVLKEEIPSSYEPDKVKPGIVGSGGTEIWTLTPVAKGADTLRFEYCRPWEKDTPPAQTVSYRIMVK